MPKDEATVQYIKIVLGVIALAGMFLVLSDLDAIKQAVENSSCSVVHTTLK